MKATLLLLSLIFFFSCKKKDDKQESFIQPDGGVYGEVFTGGQFHLGH